MRKIPIKRTRTPRGQPQSGQMILHRGDTCFGKIHIAGFYDNTVNLTFETASDIREAAEFRRVEGVDTPELLQLVYKDFKRGSDLDHYFYKFHTFELYEYVCPNDQNADERKVAVPIGTAIFRSFHKVKVPQKSVATHLSFLELDGSVVYKPELTHGG